MAEPVESYTCPDCHTGLLRLRYLAYFTRVQGELVTVPNFPAWVCDVCGYREDDARARNWLSVLLNPAAGRKKNIRRMRRNPGRRGNSDTAHT